MTSYVTGDMLNFDCIVNYRDGVLRETFIRTCRQFTRNIENGLAKFDIDNIFVLPPEKPEAEEIP